MSNDNLGTKIISGSIWKFLERISAQGVSFIVSLILTRILSPSDYGVIAIINIFINIAEVLLVSGLNTSLIQKKNPTKEDYDTIFWCNIIIGLVLYLFLYLSAPFVAQFYSISLLIPAIRVFALRLPISSFQSIQIAYVSKSMQFRKFFFATLSGALVSAIVGILMAITGFGVWALICQYIVNTVISTLTLFSIVDWRPGFNFSITRAQPLINYGWKVMMTDLIGTIFNNLSDFLIGAKFSSVSLAFFSKGRQLPQLVRNNIFTSLISVLFPGMSQVNDDNKAVKSIARKSISMLSFLIFPMMVGLIVTAQPLTIIMYTRKWLPIVPYVYIVCIEAMLSVIPTITQQSIKALGRSDLMLKLEFIKKPLILVIILFSIRYGVFAVALTIPINTIIDLITNAFVVKRIMDYSFIEQVLDIFPALLMSVFMGIVVSLTTLFKLNIILMVIIQVLIGIFIYLCLSIVFKDKNYLELKKKLIR